MKNFLLSTCLLLMSASALAQENVLSETWGQKLDLTIQSSETPSTWVLDSKVKQEIMMGLTCCYRNELINYVQTEHLQKSIGLKLKEKRNKLQYTLYEDRPEIQNFIIWSVLDVYTTHRAVELKKGQEANPFLAESPDLYHLIVHKAVTSYMLSELGFFHRDNEEVLEQVNIFGWYVVMNNAYVLNR